MSKEHRIPARDRRQQIMQVAMELFARQGFKGTTTRQIAQRARVNEAIIFRHFPSKEDLYWSIIDQKCRVSASRDELKKKLEATDDDRALFSHIAEDFLQRNSEDTTLGRLLLYSALENHRLSRRFFRTYVAERYELLADRIRTRIGEGRFRTLDPLLAARGFLGMIVHHFLIQELFGGKRYQKFDARHVVDTLTDIWLRGMLTANGNRSRPAKTPKRRLP